MKKRLLILFLFSLFAFDFAKSKPIINYPPKTSKDLTITNCSWELAEFWDENSMTPYERSFRDPIRYCVDKKNNTIFSYWKDMKTNEIVSARRELGFLNKIEIPGIYISPEIEWKIENNNLVKYSCYLKFYGQYVNPTFPCNGDLIKEYFPKIK